MAEQNLGAHRRFISLISLGIKPAIVLTRKARLICAFTFCLQLRSVLEPIRVYYGELFLHASD